MAVINNISFYKGEAVALIFTMSPVTDITGWTIEMTINFNMNDAVPLLSIPATLTTPLSGIFTCSMTHAQTLALGVGTYAYDVQRTDSGSEAVLSIGELDIIQEALYP